MENQKILFKLRAMVRLQRKQEVTNKKIMKLMKEMIELHDFMAELQTLTNELGAMEIRNPVPRV